MVKVGVTDGYKGVHYSLTFEPAPGFEDTGATTQTFAGAHGAVYLVPDVPYVLTADTVGEGFCGDGLNDCWHLGFDAACYQIEVDGARVSYLDVYTDQCVEDISWSFILRSPASHGSPGASDGPTLAGTGVEWRVSAGGVLADAGHAGTFLYRQSEITIDSFSPDALFHQAASSHVDTIGPDANGRRQVVTPEGVFDLQALSGSAAGFELRFYPASALAGLDGNGWHTFNDDPLVIHQIGQKMDGGQPIPSTIQFSETRDQITQTHTVALSVNGTAETWTHEQDDGLIRTTRHTVPVGDDLLETTTLERADGGSYLLESKTITTHRQYPWGWDVASSQRLIADPPGGSEQWENATTYTYFGQDTEHPASPGSPAYGRLKWVIHPDGSWASYQYAPPSYGNYAAPSRPTRIRRPWLGSPAHPEDATAANCHEIQRAYGSAEWESSYLSEFLLGETEHILGTQVRRTTWDNFVSNIYLPFPGFDHTFQEDIEITIEKKWLDSSTALETETMRFTSRKWEYWDEGDNLFYTPRLAGRPVRTTRPDGSRTTWQYEFGTYNHTTATFTPDSQGDYLQIHETSTHEDSNFAPQPYQTTRTTRVECPLGRTLVTSTHIHAPDDSGGYTGSDPWPLISRTLHHHDPATRHLLAIEQDGRITLEQTWLGNRLLSSTDEDGTTTTYSNFDALDRPLTTTRAGVSTTHTLDASGRTLTTTRGSGAATLTTATTYDLLGRTLSHTDENNLETTWQYGFDVSGNPTTTLTAPSGATTVTTTHLDGQTASITGTAVTHRHFTYDLHNGQRRTTVHHGQPESPRWETTLRDDLGRTYSTQRPGYTGTTTETRHYDDGGRHTATLRTGFAPQRTEYDHLGRPWRQGIDHSATGTLDPASADTITETTHTYQYADGAWHQITHTYQYLENDNPVPTLLQRSARQLSALPAGVASILRLTNDQNATTTHTETIDRALATRIRTTQAPHATQPATETHIQGRLTATTTHSIQEPTLYEYDTLGRPWRTTDPRTGQITTTTYHPGTNQIHTLATPAGTTTYLWVAQGQPGAGQLASQTNPLGHATRHAYNLRGQQTHTWGDATYPTLTEYDTYGTRTHLHTFRDPQIDFSAVEWPAAATAAAGDTTQWHYQPSTGLLVSKEYADSTTTQYTYNDKNLLHTLTRAREAEGGGPLTTTHTYNAAGHRLTTTHSDTTPGITRILDRRGLPSQITDAAGTRTLNHTAHRALASETFTAGPLSGITLTATHDDHHRLENTTLLLDQTPLAATTHSYHPAHGRLATTTDGSHTISTTYHDHSDLIHTRQFDQGTTTRLTTTHTYDTANRLQTISSTAAAQPADPLTSFTYQHDDASRRTRATLEDDTAWHYDYNPRGELTSAQRLLADQTTPYPGTQFAWQYDPIGNHLQTTSKPPPTAESPTTPQTS